MRVASICAMLVVSAYAGAWPFAMQDSPAGTPKRLQKIWQSAEKRMTAQSNLWFKDGDYPKVIQLLKVRVEVFPTDYNTVTDLGYMLESTQKPDEALALYVRFRQANPSNPDAAFPEANFYFARKLYAKVPPLLEPSLTKRPQPNAYRILAHSYERLGLLSDSKRVWEAYIKTAPEDGAAKANLRRVADKLGTKPGTPGRISN